MKIVYGFSAYALIIICVSAFSNNPPNGRTGAPGESTCGVSSCHGNLNVGSGEVSINGPDEYVPGDTLDFTVNLSDSGQQRWGFELTVLEDNDEPAGEIIVTDSDRMQLETESSGRQYIQHRRDGTDPGVLDTAPGWNFRWLAPSEGNGQAIFYVAGNAANGNGARTGDFIYTASKSVTEKSAGLVSDEPHSSFSFYLSQNYPNPFNPHTSFRYYLPRDGHVVLVVYDASGKAVAELVNGRQHQGWHQLRWNAGGMAGGVYFVKMTSGRSSQTRRMILLK